MRERAELREPMCHQVLLASAPSLCCCGCLPLHALGADCVQAARHRHEAQPCFCTLCFAPGADQRVRRLPRGLQGDVCQLAFRLQSEIGDGAQQGGGHWQKPQLRLAGGACGGEEAGPARDAQGAGDGGAEEAVVPSREGGEGVAAFLAAHGREGAQRGD